MLETLKSRFVGDQLKADLLNQIRSGKLIPGNLVLSERKLAENYRISYLSVGRLMTWSGMGCFTGYPGKELSSPIRRSAVDVISTDRSSA